jgi:hypothetical protein
VTHNVYALEAPFDTSADRTEINCCKSFGTLPDSSH